MSLTVVGSIAFDAISTPFGERERALGGSAVHFSLAASFFTEVRPVGPVGDDFGEAERDALVQTISGVDMVLMNDAELRMLTEEPNLVKAAGAVRGMGPRAVIAKQGEYGAALFTGDGFFALPAYPLETVRDPTGAGDSFAGGLMGYLDSQGGALDDATLRRAMAYGSTLASFWVEEFGCERAERLTRDEIDERYEHFKRITAIDSVPATG